MTDAAYFDQWYANMAESPMRDEIVQRALGLPPELKSTSLLSWDAIAEVVAALELDSGQVLLDLACGRGGYGLEIARRSGARLIGVDFSAVAVQRAQRRTRELGLENQADFRVGDLARTGLSAASIDAVVCIDAIQFAEPVTAALRECRRVLAPGGRAVITSWEATNAGDEQLPPRLRNLDLATQLVAAGFEQVRVTDKPGWREAERAMWLAATTIDAGNDPALQAMQDEGRRVLALFDALRRVLATARAPG